MTTLPWSESLQEQTREAIKEMRAFPDGNLHVKHKALGYGTIRVEDLICGSLTLHHAKTNAVIQFANVDALLEAGWAID